MVGVRPFRARAGPIADGIEREANQLAEVEARNVGMPISDARGAIDGAAATFRFYADVPKRPGGQTVPVAGGVDMTFREPIGVVGVITPWNFPLTIARWKIAPAPAAGDAVIYKPSELTPLTARSCRRSPMTPACRKGCSPCWSARGRASGAHSRRGQDRDHGLDGRRA